jgi:hypothetical protein
LARNIRNKATLPEEQEHLYEVIAKLGKQPHRAREQAENQPRHNPDRKPSLHDVGDGVGDLFLALGAIAPADVDRLIDDVVAVIGRRFGKM